MLNLVTGVPGASKTAYVVTQLFDIERKNKINLKKNILVFQHNKSFQDKFKDDFSYIEVEDGSGHELKTILEVLDENYFDMLGQDFDDLRPDDYYYRSVRYNEIIERIRDRGEPEDFLFFQPVRTIYANIKALKIDYARALTYDWRLCPDGSIIVIDEVQLVEPYSDLKDKNNPIIQELTIHRHRGFDFWFITQAPSYMHPTIKELISCHLHITRPYWRTPKIYQFGSLRQYPNTLINKLNCESKFNFKPKDFVFKLYKSTSIDTSKKRTPKGLIGFGIFILFALFIMGYGLSGGSGFLGHFFGADDKKETTNVTQAASNHSATDSSNSVSPSSDKNALDLSLECRKAANVEKPECVQWFNNLTKNGGSVNSNQDNMSVSYNPNKPFDNDHIQEQIKYNVTAKPVFSGCIKKNGKYVAYTQQGTILNEVSSADCQKLIEHNDRPFNYFASENQQRERSAPELQVSNPETSL